MYQNNGVRKYKNENNLKLEELAQKVKTIEENKTETHAHFFLNKEC